MRAGSQKRLDVELVTRFVSGWLSFPHTHAHGGMEGRKGRHAQFALTKTYAAPRQIQLTSASIMNYVWRSKLATCLHGVDRQATTASCTPCHVRFGYKNIYGDDETKKNQTYQSTIMVKYQLITRVSN